METFEYLNCRWCGTRMAETVPHCPSCGAPNSPEPLPWLTTMGLRLKASLVSKQKSVWADRLASLMPLHFLFALLQLGFIIFFTPALGSFTMIAGISAAVSILYFLIFYPNWYNESPDNRMVYGLIYVILLIIYIAITKHFFLLLAR